MKLKHLAIRIEQCLSLAKASNCPRRKFGALLLDPDRNVILMDGYNGGPRHSQKGPLCGGTFCERDGLTPDHYVVVPTEYEHTVYVRGPRAGFYMEGEDSTQRAEAWVREQVAKYPPIKSGTQVEVGCHHAEMNVICNAAASGVKTKGAWLIVTGEPCRMCAKLIHHAGITRVILVGGGYAGDNGVQYLEENGVGVEVVGGPKDPRSDSEPTE